MEVINNTTNYNYSINHGDKAAAGDVAFDIGQNTLVIYNGSNWINLDQSLPIIEEIKTPELTWEEYDKMREMTRDWERKKYPERFL